MKKIFILLISIFTFISVNAQQKENTTQKEKVTFGSRIGGSLNKITGKNSIGGKLEEDFKLGASGGFNFEIPLTKIFFLQIGILYANKGSKRDEYIAGKKVTSTTQLSYAELPLNLILKPQLGSGRLVIGAGPYAAYAFIGHFDQSPGSGQSIKFKNTVKSSDPSAPYLRALDAGINILLGYQFKNGLSFQFNGQSGILEINPKYENDPSDKSSYNIVGFGVSMGYRFHSKHS